MHYKFVENCLKKPLTICQNYTTISVEHLYATTYSPYDVARVEWEGVQTSIFEAAGEGAN